MTIVEMAYMDRLDMHNRLIWTIYIIRNTVNDKVYIGQTTTTLAKRMASHLHSKRCKHLANAINIYGANSFYIEDLACATTQEDADFAETQLIKDYDSIARGYNIKQGGQGKGWKMTFETRRKLSIRNRKKTPDTHIIIHAESLSIQGHSLLNICIILGEYYGRHPKIIYRILTTAISNVRKSRMLEERRMSLPAIRKKRAFLANRYHT